MDLSSFHPNSGGSTSEDKLSARLKQIAQTILVLTCGLFPLYFLPMSFVPSTLSKLVIFSVGIALTLLFYMFAVLRDGRLAFRLPWPVLSMLAVVVVTMVAAVLSGDLHDALIGNAMENHTAAFTLLMALTVMMSGVWAGSKLSIIRLYSLLIFSSLVLALWHVARLIFGSDVLSLGIFTSDTSSLLGGWNGLAIFFGLIILLSLVAVQKLPLTRAATGIIFGISTISLLMLAVIGFSVVWQVLAVVSILMVIYTLSKHMLPRLGQSQDSSVTVLVLIVLVAITSSALTFGGNTLSNWVGEKTGINYLEVRPSALATLEIDQAVLKDNLLFGIGPNRFADAWRMHKDPVINQTIFWNSDFSSGYNYIGTSVVGSGLLGAIAWLLFFASILWCGVRFLFKASTKDHFWSFIGLSSLVSTLYLWLMSWLYVPPASILILSALTTGVFLVAYTHLLPGRTFNLSALNNRNYGFILIAVMVLTVTGSVASLYVVGKQTYSLYTFNNAIGSVEPGDSINQLEEGVVKAFNVSRNDAYAGQLAYYQLLQMNSLMNVAEPTAEQRQLFEDAVSNGISSVELAISLDPTDPSHHRLLAEIYTVLSQAGVEGAKERAIEEYALAQRYNPKNPLPLLLMANLQLINGDIEGARVAAEDAVRLRPTYTEAIFFLTQLDINEGKTEQALARTVSLVQLEPQNPARRYQLGILLASVDRLDEAVLALEQAVVLDPQYANARYFLALGYAEKGLTEQAIEQLSIVRELNESNKVVDDLITRLKSGDNITNLSTDETVEERNPDEGGAITTEDLEDTDLVTSSNAVTEETSQEEIAE